MTAEFGGRHREAVTMWRCGGREHDGVRWVGVIDVR
jgi:hypothetical protein